MNEEPDYIQTNWEHQLTYKHSTAGAINRKIRSIRRKGKKRYARWGFFAGLALAPILAALALILLRSLQ